MMLQKVKKNFYFGFLNRKIILLTSLSYYSLRLNRYQWLIALLSWYCYIKTKTAKKNNFFMNILYGLHQYRNAIKTYLNPHNKIVYVIISVNVMRKYSNLYFIRLLKSLTNGEKVLLN